MKIAALSLLLCSIYCESEKLHAIKQTIKELSLMVAELENELHSDEIDISDYEDAMQKISEKKHAIARKILVKISKTNNHYSKKAFYWIAYCLYYEGKKKESTMVFIHFIETIKNNDLIDPELAYMKKTAYQSLIKIYIQTGQPKDAQAILEKFEAIFPNEEDFVKKIKNKLNS